MIFLGVQLIGDCDDSCCNMASLDGRNFDGKRLELKFQIFVVGQKHCEM